MAFGRPKGDRRSYLQWEEGGIAPQVVFEILSPNNRPAEMLKKFQFYERYGVEEYYVYDPDSGKLTGYLRQDGALQDIADMTGWVSPRLKVRFELVNVELHLFGPDGRRFATYIELARESVQVRQEKEKQHQRAERLAAQLRALGVEPEA